MQSHEIRQRFLDFFAKRGHAVIPSASLVPENDPSVLFNTAGMQPLVPYLMGQKHPLGNRLASCQKCVRTGDLDDIGDNRHFSFFEMLGNWSLGDYFKEDAIKWSYEFLTSKEEGLGLDPSRLYVTIFEGDENAPYDQESKDIWLSLGIPEHRIYALPGDDNWWSPGDNGPCGPCSEMFYDMTGTTGDLDKDAFIDACKREDVIEIWNDVFMEYEKKDGKVIGKLAQKNVDTGAGLERLTAVMQGKKTAYETDLLQEIISYIQINSKKDYREISGRIIADHVRTATLMISDGVVPANKDRGYVLRRLIRRALVQADSIGLNYGVLVGLRSNFAVRYEEYYTNLKSDTAKQHEVFKDEVEKFNKTLHNGLKEFEKGIDPFILATTYGFPIELTEELAKEKGITIDRAKFDAEMKEHQEKSRSASAGMFKGGLAGHGDMEIKYHTATHMLNQALREVLGNHVVQKGSNITPERLRFDFSHADKMTDEEIKRVESLVNEKIQEALPIIRSEMSLDQARLIGALGVFGDKYESMVSVYQIGEGDDLFSREICGGPHVENTKELGTFSIKKEEASSAGVRRIKAVLS